MKFSKIRNVKSPSRGTFKSAGIDFYVPIFDDFFVQDFNFKNSNIRIKFGDKKILLASQERCLIPSGIKVSIPQNYMLGAFNKSGVCTKKGLIVGAQIIDEDY